MTNHGDANLSHMAELPSLGFPAEKLLFYISVVFSSELLHPPDTFEEEKGGGFRVTRILNPVNSQRTQRSFP